MLYIAEKPELARAIVDALGGGGKKNGCYECGKDRVTWCFGHMLRLCEPEEYDPSLKKWTLDSLPLVFAPWKKRPVEKAKDQLHIILDLLKSADAVVNAGDPDAEGQLLVDEILQYAGFKGKVLRVLINDNTPALVKKALANLRDNADFAGLSAAAEARQVGDWHYGLNLTRLYTLVGRREGYPDMLSVGRVQTPILGLVVRRDREHEGHKKSSYYVIQGQFQAGGVSFTAIHRNKPDDPQDDKGRLTDGEHAQAVADAVGGKTATIISVETKKGETPPPLPYNLLALQADASRLHGIFPDRVREITQALREKHRLITYNRSDSRHLSEEQHADAPAVIAAIAGNVPDFADHVGRADATMKSRAFDSSRVTAHHAIIPTQTKADFSTLSLDENRLYLLIARAYLVQFMPPQRWERTVAALEVEGHAFVHTCRVVLENGWRDFHAGETDGDGEEDDDNPAGVPLAAGGEAACLSGACIRKETAPKPLYTMASLLEDLTRVAQYVRDDKLRKILIDKDRGKAGEHGGIGTPATRDVIIKTLFDRGFIEVKKTGKTAAVVSAKAGRDFYDALPDNAKFPDLTALWHQQQLDIERGGMTADAFVEELVRYIGGECARVIKDGLGLTISTHPCPSCGKPMRFIKHPKGDFWGCIDFPACKKTLKPDGDKPAAGKHPQASAKHVCKQCGKGLVRRKTKQGTLFWGCSSYPTCRAAYSDRDGKPNYAARGVRAAK
jgi:DNA topoisomerase-3